MSTGSNLDLFAAHRRSQGETQPDFFPESLPSRPSLKADLAPSSVTTEDTGNTRAGKKRTIRLSAVAAGSLSPAATRQPSEIAATAGPSAINPWAPKSWLLEASDLRISKAHAKPKDFLFLRVNFAGLQINTQWHAHPGYVRCRVEAALGEHVDQHR